MRLLTSNRLRNVSISGIFVIILALITMLFGFKDYQSQENVINNKYESFYRAFIMNQSILNVENTASSFALLNKEPKNELAVHELSIERLKQSQEFSQEIKKLEQQKKEELDNRIFDLITYISLSLSILVFGISLFWRKRDMNDSRAFQDSILNQIVDQTANMEQLQHINKEQKQILSELQKINPRIMNRRRKRNRFRF
ncbi:hypothetical protein SFC42_22450 [Priestia filamentosa]|uniref:hypothetical protein n=1 Tax=Priestia filamentosa TaxID=1402861 RepID=UPI00398301F9